jgi:serine/threonine protein kinase
MELVKGTPLTRFCDENRLTVPERLAPFVQVCQAVQHAQQKVVIRRDLKPSNVFVAEYDGRSVPKVIDFGIAKAAGPRSTDTTQFTEVGAVVGMPEYMSPEQAEANPLDMDTRSDVFSLGVVHYELLTGSTPMTRARVAESPLLECAAAGREEEPPRPSTRLRPDDWGTYFLHTATGAALAGQGRHAEAEPLLVSGYEGLRERRTAIPPAYRARVTIAVHWLAELYDACAKPDEGRQWRSDPDDATGKSAPPGTK